MLVGKVTTLREKHPGFVMAASQVIYEMSSLYVFRQVPRVELTIVTAKDL